MIYTIILTITMLPGVILLWDKPTNEHIGPALLVITIGLIAYYWMGYFDGKKASPKGNKHSQENK